MGEQRPLILRCEDAKRLFYSGSSAAGAFTYSGFGVISAAGAFSAAEDPERCLESSGAKKLTGFKTDLDKFMEEWSDETADNAILVPRYETHKVDEVTYFTGTSSVDEKDKLLSSTELFFSSDKCNQTLTL
ncbi:hypothetical protein UY3_13972 [Chelonia mydas]|uniref:Uncharacterized protein n=1 Tax=Chelonia mydas TaxID=8469 RepID=M7B9V5_CHEMY|nr:hypothetical protein UY3_13972 [Chelonia mydas]